MILAPTPPPEDCECHCPRSWDRFNQLPLPIDDDDYVPQPAIVHPNDDDVQYDPPQINEPHLPVSEPHLINVDDATDSDTSSTTSKSNSSDTDNSTSMNDNPDDNNDNDHALPGNTAPTTGQPQCRTAGTNSRFDDYHLFTTAAKTELPIDESTLATVCHFLMVHYSQPPPPTRRHPRSVPTKTKSNVFSLSAGLKQRFQKNCISSTCSIPLRL